MLFKYHIKIIKKPLRSFYEEITFELTKRLGGGDYATPHDVLKNWNLVRIFEINRYKLTYFHIHLLE